jgi:peptide/nickel transport system substrate-binding protein
MLRSYCTAAGKFGIIMGILLCAIAVQAGSASDKTLRFTMYEAALGSVDNGTLDPLRTYNFLYFTLQHQIFETLVAVDFKTQQILPVLARKWEISKQNTIRFFLRRGVRFHNGEEFNAASVKFSIDLMKDPRNKFSGRFHLASIAAVQVIDDYTVEFVLNGPDALLLRKLAAIGFIFPPKYCERVGEDYFSRYPVGTGPFRFFYFATQAGGGREIHFVANEDYWGGAVGLQELVYCAVPKDKQWEALDAGAIDLLITQVHRPTSLPDNAALNIFTERPLRNSVCLLNIDKQGPLQDIRVRKAIEHAVNRGDIIARALAGHAQPLYTAAPVGSLAYSPGPALYPEDKATAQNLLKEAGLSKGCTLTVMASSIEPAVSAVNVLKAQLAGIGIKLEPRFLSRDEIIKEIVSPKLMGKTRPSSYDMWVINGWPDIFGAAAHFYFLFLHSRGLFNFGTYRNAPSPVDALLAKTLEATDDKDLAARLQQFDRAILEQALVIPLYQPELMYGMKKNVHFKPGLNDLPLNFMQCTVQ